MADVKFAVVDEAQMGFTGQVLYQVLVGTEQGDLLRVKSGGTTFFNEDTANGVAASLLRDGADDWKLVSAV